MDGAFGMAALQPAALEAPPPPAGRSDAFQAPSDAMDREEVATEVSRKRKRGKRAGVKPEQALAAAVYPHAQDFVHLIPRHKKTAFMQWWLDNRTRIIAEMVTGGDKMLAAHNAMEPHRSFEACRKAVVQGIPRLERYNNDLEKLEDLEPREAEVIRHLCEGIEAEESRMASQKSRQQEARRPRYSEM